MNDSITVKSEPSAQTSSEDSLQDAQQQARALLQVGLTPAEVKTHLENQGLEPQVVSRVVRKSSGMAMLTRPKPTTRKRARRHLIWGGLWCLGGLAVTLLTYLTAAPGGTFVVAYGAIIYGLVRLVRGLREYL
jgi:hypothetical protein